MKQGSLIALIVVIVSAACAPTRPTSPDAASAALAPAVKQRLVGSVLADPPGMFKELTNPGGNGNVPGLAELTYLLHAGATYSDDLDVLQPQLAEAVPSAENGLWKIFPDGRMDTTWRLKPNVTWHDGTPLTAEDFVFAVQVNSDKDIGVVTPAMLSIVDSVEAPDPRTILVKWKEPFIEADSLFSSSQLVLPLPRHLLEKPFNQDKAAFLGIPYWTSEFVGAGPFRLREWIPGSHLTMVANDRYTLGRPKLDEIEVRFITDVNVIVANLLSGSVEKHLGRGLGVDQTLQLRDLAPTQNVLLGGVLGSVVPMYPQFVNPDPPILTNLEFRRALLMAIDRQEMSDSLNFKLSPVAESWLAPDRAEYAAVKSKVVTYPYDPRRAAQAIEALGYTKGADGIYQDAAGQKLLVNVRTTAQRFIHPLSASAVADYWKRLGVGGEFENAPIPLLGDREYRSTFPGFELVVSGNNLRSSSIRQYTSAEIPLPSTRFVGGNRARYQNAMLDGLIDRYLRTIPMGERLATLGDAIHIQTDQLSMFTLFYEGTTADLGPKNLKGVTSAKVWNAHLWQLE